MGALKVQLCLPQVPSQLKTGCLEILPYSLSICRKILQHYFTIFSLTVTVASFLGLPVALHGMIKTNASIAIVANIFVINH